VIEALQQHEWSGNVRELANALEHAVILSDGSKLAVHDLPASVSRPRKGKSVAAPHFFGGGKTLREIEMDVIHQVLDKHAGDKPKAAQELGIALKTLYNKLNQTQNPAAAG
jgi:DNA-binding NtrC family response regulator